MGMLQYRKTCETLHLQTQTLENPEKIKTAEAQKIVFVNKLLHKKILYSCERPKN